MKKLFIAILLFALMFSFVSCKDEPPAAPVNPGAAIPSGVPEGVTPRSMNTTDLQVFSKMVEDGEAEFNNISSAFDDFDIDLDLENFTDTSGKIVVESTQEEDVVFETEYYNGVEDKVASATMNGFNAVIEMKEGDFVISGSIRVAMEAPDLDEKFKVMTEYTFEGSILDEENPVTYTYMDGETPIVVPFDEDETDIYNLQDYVIGEACSRSLAMYSDVDFQNFAATYKEIASVAINGKGGLLVEIEPELTLGFRAENLDISAVLNGAELDFSFKNFKLALTLRLGGLFGGTGTSGATVDFEAESVKISGKSGDVEINAEASGHVLVDDVHTTVDKVKNYTKSTVDINAAVGVAVSVGENSVGYRTALVVDITDPEEFAAFELEEAALTPVAARINADYVDPDEFLETILKLIPEEE